MPTGRFAPSPSGPLHLGNLRTAMVAWLCARSDHSRFIVRIEDLDPITSRREHEVTQLADLAALGLAELRQFSPLVGADVFKILSLEGSLASRDHAGGTAPRRVRAAVKRARKGLK